MRSIIESALMPHAKSTRLLGGITGRTMSRIRRWRKLARIANRQGNQLQGINSDVGAFGSVFDFSPPAFAVSFMGMAVDLTEALLSKAAGWEAMKHARAYLSQGQVLSSYWAPPLLRGVVQAGE